MDDDKHILTTSRDMNLMSFQMGFSFSDANYTVVVARLGLAHPKPLIFGYYSLLGHLYWSGMWVRVWTCV